MLRRAAATVAGCVILVTNASAQQQPDVVVELRHRGESPAASVSIRGLLSDARFLSAMQSGFPLYLEYQVELRRTRSNWFDDVVSQTSWEYVVHFDPVRETFVVENAFGREELSGEDALQRLVETVLVFELTPDREGRYYYSATVSARTLSDSDVDEVFDWLKGDDDTTSVRRHGFITRSARRLLVQIAPLPRFSESAESPKFRWP